MLLMAGTRYLQIVKANMMSSEEDRLSEEELIAQMA